MKSVRHRIRLVRHRIRPVRHRPRGVPGNRRGTGCLILQMDWQGPDAKDRALGARGGHTQCLVLALADIQNHVATGSAKLNTAS
eukprot:365705-Chlamydomonas_euryale.AAC.8